MYINLPHPPVLFLVSLLIKILKVNNYISGLQVEMFLEADADDFGDFMLDIAEAMVKNNQASSKLQCALAAKLLLLTVIGIAIQ